MTLRVAIVDDEPLARRRLKRLVTAIGGAEVVAEIGDGRAALARIPDARVDVALMDVQMPEPDGLAVAAALPEPRPLVVFVTAFDRYAVQAFELHAVDYLLKPVSRERLAEALARARERLIARAITAPAGFTAIADRLRERPRWLERLPVRTQGRVELVDVRAIEWIDAADNYVTLHAGRRTYLVRETLSNLERALDPGRFVRIHRSVIVRIDAIDHLQSVQRGDYEIRLRSGATVALSRTYRERLEKAVGRRI